MCSGNNELMVDGLLAMSALELCPFFGPSYLATGLPVTDPVARGVVE